MFKARDANGKFVAVKATQKELFERRMVSLDEESWDLLVEENAVKEALILEHLSSESTLQDNVAHFISFFESCNWFYVVVEWIDGCTLSEFAGTAHALIAQGKLRRKDWAQVGLCLIFIFHLLIFDDSL